MGFYDPIKNQTYSNVPAILYFLEKGAQPTETVYDILSKTEFFKEFRISFDKKRKEKQESWRKKYRIKSTYLCFILYSKFLFFLFYSYLFYSSFSYFCGTPQQGGLSFFLYLYCIFLFLIKESCYFSIYTFFLFLIFFHSKFYSLCCANPSQISIEFLEFCFLKSPFILTMAY